MYLCVFVEFVEGKFTNDGRLADSFVSEKDDFNLLLGRALGSFSFHFDYKLPKYYQSADH